MVSRLLVTGGAGFIGANFVHYWLANHPADRVVVLDALTYAGNIETLTPLMGNLNFRFVKGNICNNELVELLLREEGSTAQFYFMASAAIGTIILGMLTDRWKKPSSINSDGSQLSMMYTTISVKK
jgi:dTDP-glucose 4,6-dehydratase